MAANVDLAMNIFARDLNAEKKIRSIGNQAAKTAAKLETLNRSQRDSRRDLSHYTSALAKSVGSMAKFAAKASAITAGVSVLAGGLAQASGAVVAFTAALAPSIGILAAVPSAIGTAGAAIAALKVATKGLGEAFSAAFGEADEFNEAVKDLSPNAQKLAKSFRKIAPELTAIREAAQDAFTAGLDKSLTQVSKTLMGPLRKGLTQTSSALNVLVKDFAEVAASSTAVGFVNASFRQASKSIRDMSKPLSNLVNSLMLVGTAAMPAFDGLSQSLAKSTNNFAEWLAAAAESGKVTEWIQGAVEVFKLLGSSVKSLVGIFGSIGKAAEQAGADTLTTFAAVLKTLDEFFKTAEGQTALVSVFKSLQDIGQALNPVIVSLAKAIGNIAPVIADLVVAIGPGLSTVLDTLGEGLAELGKGMVPLFKSVSEAVKSIDLKPLGAALGSILAALAPLMPLIGEVLGVVVELGSALIKAFGPVIEGAVAVLVAVMEPLLPVLSQIGDIVASTLTEAWSVLGSTLQDLAPHFASLASTLGEALVPLFQVWADTVKDSLPALQELAPKLVELAGVMIEMWTPVLEELVPMLGNLAMLVGKTLVEALVELAPTIILCVEGMATLVSAITPAIAAAAKFAGMISGSVVKGISKVIVYLAKCANFWIQLGADVIKSIGSMIGAVGSFIGKVASFASSVISKIKSVGSKFKGLKSTIKSALSNPGGLLVSAGKAIIQGLINGISAKIGALKSKLSGVTAMIPSWKGPYEVDLKLLTPNGAAIMDGFMKGIESQVPALKQQLGGITADIGATDMQADPATFGARSVERMGGSTQTVKVLIELDDPSKMRAAIVKDIRTTTGGDVERYWKGK